MPKNIVICLDGTGNEFGDTNSNVVKLFTTLIRDPERQVVYYHPGLGTAGEMIRPSHWGRFKHWLKKLSGLMFGTGIFDNIVHAYTFLMENYRAGDKIYLFGFSRGAYTAKALAGMIYEFGILEKGNDALVPYALGLFTNPSKKNIEMAKGFQAAFGQDVSIHFVGLWDAVSSVGWAYDPVSLPYTWKNPDVKTGRHALSIDERRCFFRQNLWSASGQDQDIRQVWFPGVHSDIGGGYAEAESGLSKVTLRWMLREAEAAGLFVDQAEKTKILGNGSSQYVPPDPKGVLHESLSGGWWIVEYLPKLYWDGKTKPAMKRLKWPRGASRVIPEGSIIHESAEIRKAFPDAKYLPSNLPKDYSTEKEQV